MLSQVVRLVRIYQWPEREPDLMETEIEIVIDSLETKKNLGEYMARMKGMKEVLKT